MKIKLTQSQHYTMMESLRRYLKFNDQKKSITEAWTGLSFASHVKETIDAGYMDWVSGKPYSRCAGWLHLTEKGSKIISTWVNQGYTNLKFFRYNGSLGIPS